MVSLLCALLNFKSSELVHGNGPRMVNPPRYTLIHTMAWPSWAHGHALLILLSTLRIVSAIKFNLPAYQYPPTKCIWNAAHTNSLVIVTANVGPGENQRVDVSILDSSENRNIYLSKKGIKGETRLAITTHADGEVGVCFKNYIEGGRCSSFLFKAHSV
jgi:hypothetical protein